MNNFFFHRKRRKIIELAWQPNVVSKSGSDEEKKTAKNSHCHLQVEMFICAKRIWWAVLMSRPFHKIQILVHLVQCHWGGKCECNTRKVPIKMYNASPSSLPSQLCEIFSKNSFNQCINDIRWYHPWHHMYKPSNGPYYTWNH